MYDMKNMFNRIKYILILIIVQVIFPYEGNKNVLRSLILPGWGELSMSYNSRAKIFFASEILILGKTG